MKRREFTRKLAITGAGIPLIGSMNPAHAILPSSRKNKGPADKPWTINLFSKHLQFLGYDQMAEACAASGLDGVDLSVRPGGHVLPDNVERDLPLAAKAIEKAGLGLPMMTTGITDPEDPFTEKILRIGSDLGIGCYRMGYLRYDNELGVAKSLDNFKEKIGKLAVLNEKYGIHGAYQNHAGNRFGGPVWDIWYVIRDLDPRWIGCQYDIRHAIVEGAQSWELGMELLKDHIRCMAIKDFYWSKQEDKWRIKNVPMGQGMVDFVAYFEKARSYEIEGPISLHIEYPLFADEQMPKAEKTAAAIKTIQHDVQALKGIISQS
jgi:sugar phosphate isomerase/epimerase